MNVARMWQLYKTGIGLTAGFIESQSVTQLGQSQSHVTTDDQSVSIPGADHKENTVSDSSTVA
jgi:hypothetical protein